MSPNLALKPGSEVDYGERRFTITQVISFETVVARDVETGDLERLPLAGLRAIESADPPVPAPDLAELDDRDWAEARRRLDLIKQRGHWGKDALGAAAPGVWVGEGPSSRHLMLNAVVHPDARTGDVTATSTLLIVTVTHPPSILSISSVVQIICKLNGDWLIRSRVVEHL